MNDRYIVYISYNSLLETSTLHILPLTAGSGWNSQSHAFPGRSTTENVFSQLMILLTSWKSAIRNKQKEPQLLWWRKKRLQFIEILLVCIRVHHLAKGFPTWG